MANPIIYSLLGGIFPALVWLIFWLREDRKNPEPRLYLFTTFILGMLGVLVITIGALAFEEEVGELLNNLTLPAIVALATLEEVLKFGAAYIGGLRTREDNEPLDAMIYMITAALGFVALENTLFIFGPLIDGNVIESVITGHMRFIGASLLHVVSSGTIGFALALAYYKSYPKQVAMGIFGMILAIAFHTFFNWIITVSGAGNMWSSISVWLGVIFILWAFEKAKNVAPKIQ